MAVVAVVVLIEYTEASSYFLESASQFEAWTPRSGLATRRLI
jgi:hypothetical protein